MTLFTSVAAGARTGSAEDLKGFEESHDKSTLPTNKNNKNAFSVGGEGSLKVTICIFADEF